MKVSPLFISVSFVLAVRAIPNDWLNIGYVTKCSTNSSSTKSSTDNARTTIVRRAQALAEKGPWSVTNAKVLPPSNNPHDYLSWAPYHWPNCTWCGADSRSNSGDKDVSETSPDDSGFSRESFYRRRRLRRVFRRAGLSEEPIVDATDSTSLPTSMTITEISLSTGLPDPDDDGPTPTSSIASPTDAPYEKTSASRLHAAKTSKPSCTPSPTTSMAPSATWTTCPYSVRDGVVNPDVRTLNGPGAMNSVSQAVISTAIAYAFTRVSRYAQSAAHFLDVFFLNPGTRMNPNMDFGQIVRGPGSKGRTGTFTGIIDLRGMVHIVNGILILDKSSVGDWPTTVTDGVRDWMSQYAPWLRDSPIGKVAASRPNNHGTFYVSQLAAALLFVGDNKGATDTLVNFFRSQFLDQIARSGEQPFEAVRTRPYHYRCFNLEALITNAKIGDQLGMNFWSAKSKYGATIQTALDYVMGVNPKGEDRTECLPHVAAVAAAYGDPSGKYAAYLREHGGDYRSEAYWFYDQPEAIQRTKTSQRARDGQEVNFRFECPAVFGGMDAVEVDNGVFVTCQELEPFYEL